MLPILKALGVLVLIALGFAWFALAMVGVDWAAYSFCGAVILVIFTGWFFALLAHFKGQEHRS